ncbi:MAG: aminoglycoside 3-N-acetyltransferase [Solirubrobacteraceae bacterium]|jgi:aminoglycoside 3-N-acetyltransferase|nr:aminoglycoside 3-N-acetyltransferase [Solirubrobacteraceae bacterium]
MTPRTSAIGARDVERALRRLGVGRRDTLWVHAGLQTALKMEGTTPAEKVATVLRGLDRTVAEGTLVIPTFTYSFARGEDYDVASSPSTVGVLGERFRHLPGVVRTADPMFSAAVRGPLRRPWASRLLEVRDTDCFGARSVFAYLREVDARLLFLGVGFGYCTFVHHVEQRLRVPYRSFKDFAGVVRDGDRAVRTTARYFVRDLESDVESLFGPLGDALLESGAARRATLPGGPALLLTSARAVEAETVRRVRERPDFLLRRGHERRVAEVG